MNPMRLGPGKHLHGKDLMNGAVKGEEFDYFQCVIIHALRIIWLITIKASS